MKIAIVGVGLAGGNILRTIIQAENFDSQIEIHLFETRQELGVGKAYEEDNRVKRLNIYHTELSMDPNNSNDFAEWLTRNKDHPLNFEGLASRVDCGDYVQDRLSDYFNHPQVTWFQEEVTRLTYHAKDEVYDLGTDNHDYGAYDAVFLCLGHPDYQDFYQLIHEDQYIEDPYPLEVKLAAIPQSHRVAILGTGPTGIDTFRYLMQEHDLEYPPLFLNKDDFLHLSGSAYQGNNLTMSITRQWIRQQQKADPQGFIPLEVIINLVRSDFKANQLDLLAIYHRAKDLSFDHQKALSQSNDQEIAAVIHYLELLAPYFPYLYQSLRVSERHQFIKEYEPYLDLFQTFTPALTNRWLIEAIESGQAEVLDEIEAIEPRERGFIVKGERQDQVDTIVNATGFNLNLRDNLATHPLLADLYDQGIIQPATEGKGILAKWPECQVINQRYGIMNNLYLQGMWLKGTHYRNNDFRSILSVSQEVGQQFMANYANSSQ